MSLKALLENAGFEVTVDDEVEKDNAKTNQVEKSMDEPEKEKSKEEILKERARNGEILSYEELLDIGFESTMGIILPRCAKNGVEFSFYGDNLVEIDIDDIDIEDILHICPSKGPDDDLCYRILADDLIYAYEKAGVI